MSKDELNKTLSQIVDDFASETRMLFPEGSSDTVTSGDLSELARQTFYALTAYKDAIIKFLDNE